MGSHKSPARAALTDEQRASLGRSMDTIRDHLDDAQRLALIEHSVMVAIRYATEPHSASVLHDWSRGLLATLRMHASPAYRDAIASHTPPDLSRPGISAAELLARFERRGQSVPPPSEMPEPLPNPVIPDMRRDGPPPPPERPAPLPDPVIPDVPGRLRCVFCGARRHWLFGICLGGEWL